MERILLINGPNLNLLGLREPDVYGYTTLEDIEADLIDQGAALGVEVDTFQSNHEGELIDRIHDARGVTDGIILNGGALTHYSYALYDALVAVDIPCVEVHISNIHAREIWRANSVTAPASLRTIYGRGVRGYGDGLLALLRLTEHPPTESSYGDHPSQIIDVRLPGSGGDRLAVLVHGGFWRDPWHRDTIDGLAIDLTREGWVTANIEYRRVGSGGGWPETAEDVVSAIDHAVEAHDPEEVIVIGHSAGGQLALWAAAAMPDTVDRVVSLAGVVDLHRAHELGLGEDATAEFLGGAPDDIGDRYVAASPMSIGYLGSQLVVHGTADDRVPVALSRTYIDAIVAAGGEVTGLVLEDVDHFEVVDPAHDAWRRIKEMLE